MHMMMQECVYTFQKERPIQIIPNENWRPYQPAALISPNFPAYPSGHSTFGAAFVTVRPFNPQSHPKCSASHGMINTSLALAVQAASFS